MPRKFRFIVFLHLIILIELVLPVYPAQLALLARGLPDWVWRPILLFYAHPVPALIPASLAVELGFLVAVAFAWRPAGLVARGAALLTLTLGGIGFLTSIPVVVPTAWSKWHALAVVALSAVSLWVLLQDDVRAAAARGPWLVAVRRAWRWLVTYEPMGPGWRRPRRARR